MLLNYGSTMYFVYIFAVLAVCAIIYKLIKNRSNAVKKTVIVLIALLNFLQHVFKGQIYPQYQDDYSVHLSTAYNVCGFLILAAPFLILFGNRLLKNFITYVGAFSGMIAMLVPYWFIGTSAFTWGVYRFYICHGLLFISCILPALVGLHELKWKYCPMIGLLFFGALALILINNAVLIKLGLYPVKNPDDLFTSLSAINPAWMMHPNPRFAWVADIFAKITPSFLIGNNPWGIYIPILWYAIPMYLGITLLTYLACGASRLLKKFHEYLVDSKVQY